MRLTKLFCILSCALLLVAAPWSLNARASAKGRIAWKISADQEQFLEHLQRKTFNFFWDTANPENGLIPDSFPGAKFSSVAGVGFALASYPVGIEEHYITREQGAERTLATLNFLLNAPQNASAEGAAGYKGFFYHFLRMDNGLRYEKSELSTIDTALLMAGVLTSGTYFQGDNPVEAKIRAEAEALYSRVDWPWAYSRAHEPLLTMGWTPEKGYIQYYWTGYSEAMILYVLALGSPTHPIAAAAWDRWTSTYVWSDPYGYAHVSFGPLFAYQYSQAWIDFRGIRDAYMRAKGIDYFINSRRAAYAGRAYCIANPDKWEGYGDLVWGLTASDGPGRNPTEEDPRPTLFHAYWARGFCSGCTRDDGTIAPTAVAGSIPFAPEITIPSLVYFRTRFGNEIYGKFGFKDAFNLSYRAGETEPVGWFDTHYLAIDQGPVLLMIDNYRTGFLWNLMKKNRHIRQGLERAGFTGGWLGAPSREAMTGEKPSS